MTTNQCEVAVDHKKEKIVIVCNVRSSESYPSSLLIQASTCNNRQVPI